MPDFDHALRSAQLHVAREDPYQGAYLRGMHAGKDAARWEVAIAAAVVAIVIVAIRVYFSL